MELDEAKLERIGLLVDDCDNMLSSLKIPLPLDMHIEGMASGIESIRDKLLEFYLATGGEDVWDFHIDASGEAVWNEDNG